MENDINTVVSRLRMGQPPGDARILTELSVGVDFVTDFWKNKYLDEYIREGGSKIKFITGGKGSGKTHFLDVVTLDAETSGYCTVNFSALDVWIHDFKEVYIEIFNSVDIMKCLTLCSRKIVENLGFSQQDIPMGINLMEYLSEQGAMDALTKREIRVQLSKIFLQNPLIDNNFGLACSLLVGGIIGHPVLEDHNREQLLLWLSGDKEASLSSLRRLGLSPNKITKFNARHMLRSLVEVLKIAGYAGLVVAVDDLEILINKNSMETIRYTKLKREDAYESIRELIDEIDTLKNIMFLFSFDAKLIEDEMMGLKSYQALWMRIQNEVVSQRFNRFTDIVDLDILAKQEYTADIIIEMSRKLAEVMNKGDNHIQPINSDTAQTIISHMQYETISLPLQVNIATIGGNSCD